MTNSKPTTIDEYINRFPGHGQEMLQQIRETIHAASADAVEDTSYTYF